jgi:hypothetical protein
MLRVYRQLLNLYPQSYRLAFGDEMLDVFADAQSETRGFAHRSIFLLREIAGLLKGALNERLRALTGSHEIIPFSSRRFTMRSGFRFPKSTAVLMAIILAGVLLAIEKAQSIVRSAAESDYPDLVTGMVVIFVAACVLAAVAWVGLFAMRRSGVHRLSKMLATGTVPPEIRH